MEAIKKFEPNVVGFQLSTGGRRWYIIRCYLSPDDTLTIESVVVTLKERPQGAELLVAGDSNVIFLEPEGDQRGEEIAAALAIEGLEDMLSHFLPLRCSWFWDSSTWRMVRVGMEVRSCTYYILGTDRHHFWNISIRDPRHNSDHYLVLG